jgi:UDP-glucose 4-epimerase
MKVLITGGFGYVGGRLAQHLASTSDDNVILGSRTGVAVPDWCPGSHVIRMQWASEESLREVCSGVDAVVHLAGMNAQESSADPVNALVVNGVATARIVRAAVARGVKRFIYVSTAHVYGSPLEGAITEENCALALHPYATSHRAGEDNVLLANANRQIEGIVVRLSNSFGPPAHKQVNCWMLLVNDLCRQAVTHRRMELRSAGLQRRDFITLTDACRAIAHLLRLTTDPSGPAVYNAGGEWSPTVLEMAGRIARCCREELGYSPELVRPAPGPAEQVAPLDYRISRLRTAGFVPSNRIDAEIAATLAFCVAARRRLQRTP